MFLFQVDKYFFDKRKYISAFNTETLIIRNFCSNYVSDCNCLKNNFSDDLTSHTHVKIFHSVNRIYCSVIKTSRSAVPIFDFVVGTSDFVTSIFQAAATTFSSVINIFPFVVSTYDSVTLTFNPVESTFHSVMLTFGSAEVNFVSVSKNYVIGKKKNLHFASFLSNLRKFKDKGDRSIK